MKFFTSVLAPKVLLKTFTTEPSIANQYYNKNSFMKNFIRKSRIFAIAFVIVNSFFVSNSFGQRYAVTTGNWNGAIWATTSGGAAGSAATPTSADAVTINAGVTVTVNVAASCLSLTYTSGNPGIVTGVTISGTNSLTVTNTITINGQGSTTTGSPNPLNVGAGSVSAGSIVLQGVANSASKFEQINISTGTVTVTGNITADGAESQIVFSNTGILNVGGSFLSGATGTFTASTGTVNFNGTSAQTIPNNTYNFNNVNVNNTNSSGATLGAAVSTTNIAGNITIGDVNTGSLLKTNNLAVVKGAGDVITVAAGSTLNAGTSQISWNATTGSIIINGTFQTAITSAGGFSGATTSAIVSTNSPTITLGTNSTIQYNASGAQTVTARTYSGNLLLSGSGVKTFGGAITITGNISITGASALLPNGTTSNAASLTLGGTSQAPGTWGGSAATTATHQNSTYFGSTTTGILSITCPTFTATLAVSGTNPICNGSSSALAVTISSGGTGPYTIIYSGGTLSSYTSGNNITVSPTSTTTYTLTSATDVDGCAASVSGSPQITVNPLPSSSVNSQSDINCSGGSDGTITILGSGGTSPYSYSVDNGTSWISSSSNPYIYTGLIANHAYQIRVKDTNGCTSKLVH